MIQIPTKQDLESMYNDECMSQRQIGIEFDVHQGTVSNWLHNYNISTVGRHGVKVPNVSKEVIEKMYSEDGMTQEQIGSKFDVHHSTVSRWLIKYNIQARVPMPSKEVVERMYIDDDMTQHQISREFDVDRVTVSRWLIKYNIQARVPMPSKYDLLNCISEGLNQLQIAENYIVHDSTIFRWCENYGIHGMVNGLRFATPEHINWRDAVLARDNYICQECGSQYKLQAHHIKRYCDYPELELDVDNGITLCKECHNNIRGREYQYIVKYEDIVLRDRCIGDHNI